MTDHAPLNAGRGSAAHGYKPLLDQAGAEADEGVVPLHAFVEAAAKRYWDRQPKVRAPA